MLAWQRSRSARHRWQLAACCFSLLLSQASLAPAQALEETADSQGLPPVVDAAFVDAEAAPQLDDSPLCAPCAAPAEDCGLVWPTSGRSVLAETFSVFLGLEGSKQPQDFGVNAHFGGRFAAGAGLALSEAWGLGLQIGTSINATSNAVQVMERVEGTTGRTQSFTTVGLYQRTDSGWLWAAGYDFLYQEYYDQFYLGQWRGQVGYQLTPYDEIGVWTAIRDRGDTGVFGANEVRLTSLTQGSVYYRHTWPQLAQITGWAGVAEGHNEPNAALGDLPKLDAQFVFGSELFIPLGDYLALSGQANFIMPTDTGTVDAYLGFEFFPWGTARLARRSQYSPVQTIASNTTFAVDLQRLN